MPEFALRAVIPLAGLIALLSVAPADDPAAVDHLQIRALAAQFVAARLRNEPDAVLSLLTPDAVLMPEGERPIQGAAAIRNFWFPAAGPRATLMELHDTIDEIGGERPTAYLRGSWQTVVAAEIAGKRRESTTSAYYLMIVRRGPDTVWRVARLIWFALPATAVPKRKDEAAPPSGPLE